MAPYKVVVKVLDVGETKHPNDLVSGCATLKTTKEERITGFKISVTGKERTCLQEGSGEDATTHSQTRIFLILKDIRIPDPYSIDESTGFITLPPGTYNIPFSFQLPDQLISSIEYKKASCVAGVYYCVTGELLTFGDSKLTAAAKLLTLKSSHKSEVPITVQGKPNIHRALLEAKAFQGSKAFTFSRSKEPVILAGTIDRRVVEPGENLEVILNVDNRSNKKVFELRTSVVLVHRLKAEKFARVLTEPQNQANTISFPNRIVKNQTVENIKVSVQFPENLPQQIDGQIVKRHCKIEFTLAITGIGRNLVVYSHPDGKCCTWQKIGKITTKRQSR